MKKRKILSWVLSLALVFSMTSAFAITANAGQGETNEIQSLEKNLQLDGAYDPTVSVKVNGVLLENDGDYICSNSKEVKNSKTQPQGSGYLWYHEGRLLLNGYKLDVSDNAFIIEVPDKASVTLYVDIIGDNFLNCNATAFRCNTYDYQKNTVKLVFSEKEKGACLRIDNNDSMCIEADYIEFNSGKYIMNTTNATLYHSFSIYSRDTVIINGGDITIEDAYFGIRGNIIINGGHIEINDCNTGIKSDNFLTSGGQIEIFNTECGIISEYGCDFTLNGGSIDISQTADDAIYLGDGDFTLNGGSIEVSQTGGYGIYLDDGDFTMDSGSIDISQTADDAIHLDDGDFTMDSGSIDISQTADDAIHLGDGDFTLDSGSIEVSQTGGYGIYLADGDFTMDSGSIDISQTADGAIYLGDGDFNLNAGSIDVTDTDYCIELSEGDLTMNGGKINTTGTGFDEDYYSICLNEGDFTLNAGKIDITKTGYGIYSDQVIINNAIVNIEASDCAIYSYADPGTIQIKNSNVSARSMGNGSECTAIYPSVSLTGNHTVYAGSTPADKKLVTSNDALGTYQYVEIINEQTNFNNILGSIFSNITKLFTSTSKLNLGSMLSYLLIGKLLIKIIKIL